MGATGGGTLNLGDVDTAAIVDLEGRLGAVDLQMDARLGVVGGEVADEGLGTGVDRDRGRIGVDDEGMVNDSLLGAQGEGLAGVDGAEGSRAASGDGLVVDGEVLVCVEGQDGAFDGGITGEVEVRVVGQVDDGLVSTTDQLGLVLDAQDDGLLAVNILSASGVDNLGLDSARVALIAVLADDGELNALAALEALNTGNLPGANRLGSVPDALAPAVAAAVETVGALVGDEGVRLAVDVVELGALDTIGDTADGLAEVGAVVLDVLVLGGEALYDVGAVDDEGLDDGSEREEGKGRVRHYGLLSYCLYLGEQM